MQNNQKQYKKFSICLIVKNSLKDIAEKLKQEKIYCPDYYDFGGAKNGDYNWGSDTIKRILRNKVYIGHTEYGKKINLSYKSKK